MITVKDIGLCKVRCATDEPLEGRSVSVSWSGVGYVGVEAAKGFESDLSRAIGEAERMRDGEVSVERSALEEALEGLKMFSESARDRYDDSAALPTAERDRIRNEVRVSSLCYYRLKGAMRV